MRAGARGFALVAWLVFAIASCVSLQGLSGGDAPADVDAAFDGGVDAALDTSMVDVATSDALSDVNVGSDSALLDTGGVDVIETDGGCIADPCAGKECGVVSNGCGGSVMCGLCTSPESCGAVTPNLCGCIPKACQTGNCGTLPDDGCGAPLACGACASGTCGGGGFCGVAQHIAIFGSSNGGTFTINVDTNTPALVIGIISQVPVSVTITGTYKANVIAVHVVGASVTASTVTGVSSSIVTFATLPPVIDDPPSPAVLRCHAEGGAAYDDTCNTKRQVQDYFLKKFGGNVSVHRCTTTLFSEYLLSGGSSCACTPWSCAYRSKNCGTIPDGCGGTLNCGSCQQGTCGGFGTPNVCGGCEAGNSFAGPKTPALLQNNPSVGTTSWGDLANASSVDGNFAAMSMSQASTSQYLAATHFGFAIPSNATVKGIYVEAVRSASLSSGTVMDYAVRLVRGSIVQSANRGRLDPWQEYFSGIESSAQYGGPADLWGSSFLFASDVNNVGFGTAVAVQANIPTVGSVTPRVDGFRMYVCYE